MTDQITEAELAEIERFHAATWERSTTYQALWDAVNGEPTARQILAASASADDVSGLLDTQERLVAALRAAYAQLREYESAICFEVTCTGCAKQLDALATAEAERDQAKAELAAAVVEWGEWWPDGDVVAADDREQAQRWVNVNGPNHKVVRRRVTEWQPIQEGADRG